MSRLSSLLELISFTRQAETEFVAELSSGERTTSGAPDHWTAKDLLAHVAAWRERGTQDLESARRGENPPEPEEFDEINRAIYDEIEGRSWEEVLRRADESWETFSQTVATLPGQLLAPVEPTGPGSPRPLWRRITIDAGNHPVLHYSEYARRQGRSASATRWMEGLAPRLAAIDPSLEWHGIVQYNLACHYAQIGEADKALGHLRAGLDGNPGLREWSRQDADLSSLRGDPRFSSIVGPEG